MITSTPSSSPPFERRQSVMNEYYNPFIDIEDRDGERYDPNNFPLTTMPNTTVTVRHNPVTFRPGLELFHDTSESNVNFVPTSENTTIINIHPAPRLSPYVTADSTLDFTATSVAPLLVSTTPRDQ